MDNLKIYSAVREVPTEAKTPITGGKLKGKSNINPVWRIKTLTEQFGACGIGWYYEIITTDFREGAGGEIAVFVTINLHIKVDGEWSKPIQGVGGNTFVAAGNGRLATNDDCVKMALTDAISVAAKSLGVGADVYWETDRTKYDDIKDESQQPKAAAKQSEPAKPHPQGKKTFTDAHATDKRVLKWLSDYEMEQRNAGLMPDIGKWLAETYVITPEVIEKTKQALFNYQNFM